VYRKRNNPSKCNDKSFSASTSKGACTWHQGVEKKVTQAEYNKSRKRVRHGSPKDYDGEFAPPIGKVGGKRKPASKPKTTSKRKPKATSIPKPRPVEKPSVEPTFEQYTLAQMKSLLRDSIRSVLGKKYPNGAKDAMLGAYYDSGFDDDTYPPSNASASDTRNWIAEGFFYEQEEQKMDKAFMDNWVQSFVRKIPLELKKVQLEQLESAKRGLKSKAVHGDFGNFLVSPYFNSDVIRSVQKYMEKDNKGVVLPPSIQSIDECSFDDFEKIQDASNTGNATDLDFLHSVVSLDLGAEYTFDLYCRLDGTTKDNLVWEITFNLRQTQIDQGKKGYADAFECYRVTVEPKKFDKAIIFLKNVAIVVYNLLMLLNTKKDSDWYGFASRLFDTKYVGNHGLFNVVNNLLLDADQLLVKTPSKDKGTFYRVKGTKYFIQKRDRALSLYDKDMFFTSQPLYDATLSKFACLYLLNMTNAYMDEGKLYVDVRDVEHDYEPPPNLSSFEYKAPYTKIDYNLKSSFRKAVSTKCTLFMSKLLSKDFSLMLTNIEGEETGQGTVFHDPPLKWGRTQVVIAVDRNKYWSIVPYRFRENVSNIIGDGVVQNIKQIRYDEVFDLFDLSDFLNLLLNSTINDTVSTMNKASKKSDQKSEYGYIDDMSIVASSVGLGIGESDFVLSKSKKVLEIATEYIKMLPEETQRQFVNRRKMIENLIGFSQAVGEYDGNWAIELRNAIRAQ
jgi:hypothetical protein